MMEACVAAKAVNFTAVKNDRLPSISVNNFSKPICGLHLSMDI